MNDLGPINVKRKIGKEIFNIDRKPIGKTILDFWRWSASDLTNNAMRGILAEYLVACDLGITNGVRSEWDAYDLKTKSGLRVEVKSAAYCQSWHQKKYSSIIFGINPTHGWDENTNEFSNEKKRQADVYVFCILKHKDKKTIDPLKLEQWEFYILPASALNEKLQDQKTISLSVLLNLKPKKVAFGEIKTAIENEKRVNQ